MAEKSTENQLKVGLGRAIAVRRTQLGIKRKELAERAELSYPYISEIENGMKEPSAKALRQIAEALESDPAVLLAFGNDLAAPDPAMVSLLDTSSRESGTVARADSEVAGQVMAGSAGESLRRLWADKGREGVVAGLRTKSTAPPTVAAGALQLDELALADLVREGVKEELDAWVSDVLPKILHEAVAQVIHDMLDSEVPE